MNQSHIQALDNPIWSALTSRQAHLRLENGAGLRFDPEVAPFGALAALSEEALLALALLGAPSSPVAFLSLAPLPVIDRIVIETVGTLCQMIAPNEPSSEIDGDVVRLDAVDVPEMLALTQQTKPGPFGRRTVEMGNYIGIRHEGQLVAMAGERMKLDGHTEISAVCVDDAHRGKGLAGRLMNLLRRDMLQRGELPFLHVFEHNHGAIALYEKLGFEMRQRFHLSRLSAES